uniref:Uncharacterized protein n=1 Tax=Moniliophthora roreri TaxID=221103 RepID=A0A0W0FI38_MONRR
MSRSICLLSHIV